LWRNPQQKGLSLRSRHPANCKGCRC
jgi:hypothetical protein